MTLRKDLNSNFEYLVLAYFLLKGLYFPSVKFAMLSTMYRDVIVLNRI